MPLQDEVIPRPRLLPPMLDGPVLEIGAGNGLPLERFLWLLRGVSVDPVELLVSDRDRVLEVPDPLPVFPRGRCTPSTGTTPHPYLPAVDPNGWQIRVRRRPRRPQPVLAFLLITEDDGDDGDDASPLFASRWGVTAGK